MADDFSELYALEVDLTAAPKEVAPFSKRGLKRSAVRLKEAWQAGAKISPGSGYSSRYASSIDFDEKDTESGPEVEIGPNLGKGGGSAGFLDEPLSSGGVASAPMHAGRAAVEATEEDFIRGQEAAVVEGTLKALGL